MAEFTCPAEICAAFNGDETAKQKARKLAIDWLETNAHKMKTGDIVYLPDPMTGELVECLKMNDGITLQS